MSPTMTVAECLDTYRKYGIQMSQDKLTEMLRRGLVPFGEAVELNHWSHTIWRLPFYEYLAQRGVPVTELKEYRAEIRALGWEGGVGA